MSLFVHGCNRLSRNLQFFCLAFNIAYKVYNSLILNCLLNRKCILIHFAYTLYVENSCLLTSTFFFSIAHRVFRKKIIVNIIPYETILSYINQRNDDKPCSLLCPSWWFHALYCYCESLLKSSLLSCQTFSSISVVLLPFWIAWRQEQNVFRKNREKGLSW